MNNEIENKENLNNQDDSNNEGTNEPKVKTKKTVKEELNELLFPHKTPDFTDYKKWQLATIFLVYYLIYCGVWMLPNAGFTKMVVDLPLLIVVVFLFRKVLLHDFKELKSNIKKLYSFLIFGFTVYLLIDIAGALITSSITSEIAPNSEAAVRAFDNYPILASILGFICIVIAAPIMEELMFRRVLRLLLKNRIAFFIISPLLFGIAHIVVGFSFPIAFAFLIAYVFSGIGFALLYERTNNVWIPIIIHSLYNAIAFFTVLREVFGG